MSTHLEHMKQNEARLLTSLYAALNSTVVVSIAFVVALLLILVFAQR